jgi:hypothetical protein
MGQKDRRRNANGPNRKKKKKFGKGFWAAVNYKFDSNGF